MLSRTAKSCGPDAPTLASSLAEVLSALPGSEKTLIRRRRWQKSPVTGESTTYAVKTIAQGMPGVPGYLWLLPLCFLHCTGGCGCSGHPAFPTPSRGAEISCMTRAHRAARSRTCIWNWSNVIASEAKQSILSSWQDGLLRFARNDGLAV